MPKIKEGDTFSSLQEFKDGLRRWAIEENWTPHILDSDSHRVRAGCRSAPSCPFRVRANFNTKRGSVLVTTCDGEHTCFEARDNDSPLHQNIKRSETGKLKFLLEAVPKLLTVTLDTQVQDIVDVVEKKYGQKIPVRQAQKVKNGLTPRVLGPCRHCRQTGHTRRQCPHLTGEAASRNLSFSVNEMHDSVMDGQGSDGGTYADGGLETDFVTSSSLRASSTTRDQRTPIQHARKTSINQAQPRQDSVRNDPGPVRDQPSLPSLHSLRMVPFTEHMTPTQTRLEASRLMQQAAALMEQAARLNSEAAKLNASVADQ